MTELEIHWPERDIPSDKDTSEEDDTINRWLEDPFRRKVLYAMYLLTELLEIMFISAITALVTVVSYHFNLISEATLDNAVWIAVTISIAVVIVDNIIAKFYKSIISGISFHIGYVVLLLSAYIYGSLENRKIHKYSISTVASSKVIENMPLERLVEFRNNKAKRKFRL